MMKLRKKIKKQREERIMRKAGGRRLGKRGKAGWDRERKGG